MATGTIILPILAAVPDPTNPPGLAFTTANRPYLTFDGTTDELCLWQFHLPTDYASDGRSHLCDASGLTVYCQYSMASATTNNIAFRTEVMAIADTEDVDTDNFAAVEASADDTVPGTAGNMGVVSDALATPTVAANDYIALRFGRENATSGTNATGDMEVWNVWAEYTTS